MIQWFTNLGLQAQLAFFFNKKINIKFNSKKCEMLRYGHNKTLKENSDYLTPENEKNQEKLKKLKTYKNNLPNVSLKSKL